MDNTIHLPCCFFLKWGEWPFSAPKEYFKTHISDWDEDLKQKYKEYINDYLDSNGRIQYLERLKNPTDEQLNLIESDPDFVSWIPQQ